MQLILDEQAEAQIERHKAHLPDGKDLTLLVLKGHLLVEEALDDLITAACPDPRAILDRKPRVRFALKARIAEAFTAHLIYPGLWPMIAALNTLRNELAHNLDSPELKGKLVTFMRARTKHLKLLHEQPLDTDNSDATAARLRSDISVLIAQLSGNALMLRMIVTRVDPWKKMVDAVKANHDAQ
jgi:hypothetical protein